MNVDVVTVGHAIVDVLAYAPDDQVASLGLTKGTMTLVDDERAARIHASLEPAASVSGGSAANTAACLASFGSRAAFIGKVRDDRLGDAFAEDIRSAGVVFDVPPATAGPGTGRSLVLVTPDAEKTMCTSLGIGDLVGPEDVDAALVASARVVYLEGYLCGLPHTDGTVRAVLDAAGSAGTAVALSLSDPFWVELHGAELAALLPRVDVLFANGQEACGLSGAATAAEAADELAGRCPLVVITLGADGCLIASGAERVRVGARPVERVVDTTGAGDSFAAGFLHGLLAGAGSGRPPRPLPAGSLARAGELGAVAAAEVVSHLGARPAASLRDLAAAAGLG